MPSDTTSLQTLIKNWCYQYLSILELRHGLFQDAEINRAVAAQQASSSEQLLDRAWRLVRRQRSLEQITQIQRYLVSIIVVLFLIALGVGGSAAMAALGAGDNPVNVIWSLLGLLLMPTVTLALWLVSLALNSTSPPWFGRVWQEISTRLLGRSSLLDAWKAWLELARQAGALTLWLALMSHLIWLALLSGGVIAMVAAFSLKHYTFVWETTWLSGDVFVSLALLIGNLSGWLGLSMPDAASIAASGNHALDDPVVRMQWANWLVGSVFVLGVLPRLLAATGCVLAIWRCYRRYSPNPNTAYAKAVLAQIRHDAAVELRDGPPGVKDQWQLLHNPWQGESGDIAVVGLDLKQMPEWSKAWPGLGVVDDRQTRADALALLKGRPPERLLIVVDAGQTPDRGSVSLARELASFAGKARVVMQPREGGADRSELWLAKLIEAGMELPFKNQQQATQWLGGASHG